MLLENGGIEETVSLYLGGEGPYMGGRVEQRACHTAEMTSLFPQPAWTKCASEPGGASAVTVTVTVTDGPPRRP